MTNTQLAKRLQEHATTVQGLLDILQEQVDQGYGDLPVVFSYAYGDRANTVVAEVIDLDAEICLVEYSDYHQKLKINLDDNQEEGEEEVRVFNLTAGRL